MARSSATAATILLVVLSLLAVAHFRSVAADRATEPESTAAVAVSDKNGLSNYNPAIPAEPGASATEEAVLPAEQQRHGFLRLPSHRPCHLQRRIWLGRHHGVYQDLEAPRARRFQLFRLSHHGESREAVSHLAALPAEEAREAEEVKPVAEPDPDRSVPDSDGEGEPAFGDADAAHRAAHHHDDDERAAVRAWKKEMLWRWFHFHHGMRRHRLHHIHIHHDEEEEAAPEGMKQFHFHHRHHDKEDEEKRLRHAEAEHDGDSDDEDEEVEEMVRRFRKAIMRSRRRFGHHGRRFHHNHSHRDAEKKADGEEEGGVMAWIKGLMNHF